MDLNLNDLATALKNCLNSDKTIRNSCEEFIKKVNTH